MPDATEPERQTPDPLPDLEERRGAVRGCAGAIHIDLGAGGGSAITGESDIEGMGGGSSVEVRSFTRPITPPGS